MSMNHINDITAPIRPFRTGTDIQHFLNMEYILHLRNILTNTTGFTYSITLYGPR